MGEFKAWAPPGTLRGKLQRGLGSGYLHALETPRAKVHASLSECITSDPRWDSQLDSKHWYFASLALATSLPLGEIVDHMSRDDGSEERSSYLAVCVLGLLARRGRGDAVQGLREHVRTGFHWDAALDCLAQTGDANAWAGLEDGSIRRLAAIPTETSMPAFALNDDPFVTWEKQNDEAGRVIADARVRFGHQRGRRNESDGSSTTDLLYVSLRPISERASRLSSRTAADDERQIVEALADNQPIVRVVAAIALARRGDARGFEVLRAAVADKKMPRVARIDSGRWLAELPADLVLPLARQWRTKAWPFGATADHTLKRHATTADLPWIRHNLSATATDVHMYRLCNTLEMIARFPDEGPFPEVDRAFRTMRYSFGRRFAAEALAATDPDFGRTIAFECLFDCESQTRVVGAKYADLQLPGAPERLSEMLADPTEDKFVKEAALARLGPGAEDSSGASATRLH